MLFHPISLMLILRQVFSTVLWDVTRLCMWLHDACKDSGHIYTVTCVCKGIYTFHMYIYIYIYIYTCVCMCVCMRVYTFTNVCTQPSVQLHQCAWVRTHLLYTYVCDVCVCVYMYMYIYIYIRMYVSIYLSNYPSFHLSIRLSMHCAWTLGPKPCISRSAESADQLISQSTLNPKPLNPSTPNPKP